jgi:hypothetical protein
MLDTRTIQKLQTKKHIPAAQSEANELKHLLENANWKPFNKEIFAKLQTEVAADKDFYCKYGFVFRDVTGQFCMGSGEPKPVKERSIAKINAHEAKNVKNFIRNKFTVEKNGEIAKAEPDNSGHYPSLPPVEDEKSSRGYDVKVSYQVKKIA